MSKRKDPIEIEDDPLDREVVLTNSRPNPFARHYGRSKNLRILDPDLLEIFPNSDSVNEALHMIVRAARTVQPNPQPKQKLSARRASAPKSKKRKAS